MNDIHPAQLATWLAEPLPRDVAQSVERIRSADDVRHVVLMPDIHLAADVCIGAVVATKRLIYPAAVGSDIGCGMGAAPINASADLLDDPHRAAELLAGLYKAVPGNKHTARRELPFALRERQFSDSRLTKAAGRDGRVQFGTLGRGNHFLEFQADQEERLWVLVHSGSRAMGQLIARHHVDRCTNNRSSLASIEADSEAGLAYLADVAWARAYAHENRLEMLHAIDSLLERLFNVRLDFASLIHNDHNHVQEERHYGDRYWVHRKGAQSAGDDESVIIPGSMGTATFHALGRGVDRALKSCSHGAGRKWSRGEARQQISAHSLTRQMETVWFDHRRTATLRDEAPAAYKDIRRVMRAQKELVRVVRELRPLLSYKGG
jgi:tRNA-splicing ligase RtcB (3'-phosphate/5'-hydroxy nucleic acid ligase)